MSSGTFSGTLVGARAAALAFLPGCQGDRKCLAATIWKKITGLGADK
jgi:hypothetical protein